MTPSPASTAKNILQAVFLVLLLGGAFFLIKTLAASAAGARGEHRVTYRVDGSASMAVVTYRLKDGSSTRPEDISLPWKKTVEFTESRVVILTASNPIQTGTIRCQLLLDGKVWKQEEDKSGAGKVSCAGVLP
jgi:hypothetical protein